MKPSKYPPKRELAPYHPNIGLDLKHPTPDDRFAYNVESPEPRTPPQTLPKLNTGPLSLKLASSALMPIPGGDSKVSKSTPSYVDQESGHSYIQQTWSVFSNLSDAQRNQLLKGLISRCSSKQIQLICTCLNLKSVDTSLPGARVVLPAHDRTQRLFPKTFLASIYSRTRSKRSQLRPNGAHKLI
jgi:hypothetical protein